ncbi:MAG TPA: heparan-alpha-glucosaminide N-acetyltransferase domain-containing protein [Acidobacteriaceae bacterium]|jgi:predicted acyltransferase
MASSLADTPEVVAAPVVKAGRVLSIDVLRGLTIALMILVNDPGDWSHVFRQLDHAEWNGWTLTDLVFPTFLFLMGASMLFSLEARAERGNCKKTLAGHIFARAGKIFLLDLVLGYFPRMHWAGLRLFGVLSRIALCSLLGGLILLVTRKAKVIAGIVIALLIGYWVLLRWVPVPGVGMPGRDMPFMDKNLNLAAWIDRGFVAWTQRWLHTGTLYNKTRDPEGLLSTLPAVATTLLGALAGMWMRRSELSAARMRGALALAGAVAFLAGEIWSRWFPANKNLWTSSYVLISAGLAAMAVALCSWLVDERPQPWPAWLRAITTPWLIFGSNAIAAFTVSVVLVKTMLYFGHTGADGKHRNLWGLAYYRIFAAHGSTKWTSLAFAVSVVIVCFLPNWLLWRKKIFLRL